ncbi:MAG: carboxypeptidase-like regulatory domain-containing protein [Candidatus Acidiferrales bacterium]
MRLLQSSRLILKVVAALLLSCFLCAASFAFSDLSISGKVTDAQGKPLAHATVMVYHAGVTTGYNLFCPSCYADCGKRATTDSKGMFTFKRLSPDLWFQLLVASNGYEPTFVDKIVPASNKLITATLMRRQSVSDPSRVFRGRVVDSQGLALRDAVVQPVGLLLDKKQRNSVYFFHAIAPGLDPMAITDEDGGFEIAYSQPVGGNPMLPGGGRPLKILVSVDARGTAPAFAVISAGLERHRITVTDGATVRGRLVQDGKPVGDAEVGLMARGGGFDDDLNPVGNPYYDELRIGTQPDGSFVIPNVPTPENWYIYAKMESVATRGATGNIECATKHDDELVGLGDLQIMPAYYLRGRVVLSDGKPIPDGMRVIINPEDARLNTQTAMLPADGHFEFVGLATGSYDLSASVKGYSPPPIPPLSVKGKDVDNLVITLHPNVSRAAKTTPTPKT